MSDQARGVWAINIAAVIFGTAALYGKLDVSPFWIVALRAGIGALTLALAGGLTADTLHVATRAWRVLVLSSLLLAGHWLTFFFSVQSAGVAVATLTFATFPLFTIIVEAARHRRLPPLPEIGIGAIIVLAVALLVDPRGSQNNVGGAAAGLAAALTYALFWRTSQGVSRELSPAMLSFLQNSIVCVVLFVALEPVYAIVFAALLFDEPITVWILLSISLILGASLALLRRESSG